MTKELIIAIVAIGLLIAVFFVSYILNKKTPIPKECEELKIDASKCAACQNMACALRKKEEK
ncbi:MAG: hypothetical protein J6W25_05390 [Bacilli bacterium]|nr:hypothetical protein [Bacilli bacterium]MBO7536679.1 hypothetical protein [Bacilli bacterium]